MGRDFNDYAQGKTDEEIRSEFDAAHEDAKPNGAGHSPHAPFEEHEESPLPCLSLADWLARDIPPPDNLMGELLSTTTRMLLVAPTGLGKTNFAMALAMAMAAGTNFLHWKVRRPARVLFVDGEMSRRLMKVRLADASRRLGGVPATFFALCREDVEDMPPLNMPEGQTFIDAIIERLGGVDFAIFDNVQALNSGDMKEEEGWANTLPWIKQLTKRNIGQIWVHHTGLDKTHSYGTNTREWQMDLVGLMEEIERPGTDIAFLLKFPKARLRAPYNRADFESVVITLSRDQWEVEISKVTGKSDKRLSPKGLVFHGALLSAIIEMGHVRTESANRPSVTMEEWEAECIRRGLIDPLKPHSARTQISKYRLELVAARRAVCDGNLIWNLTVAE